MRAVRTTRVAPTRKDHSRRSTEEFGQPKVERGRVVTSGVWPVDHDGPVSAHPAGAEQLERTALLRRAGGVIDGEVIAKLRPVGAKYRQWPIGSSTWLAGGASSASGNVGQWPRDANHQSTTVRKPASDRRSAQ